MSDTTTRLNRYLASCGLGSRRGCELLVREGRVQFNGQPCGDLATRVGPGDVVQVDGRRVAPHEDITILLNKPPGYLCTRIDTDQRPTIYHLIPPHLHGLHHVGRLDRDSEGLLIMTNSGEITEQLTHPRHKIEKEYIVSLSRPFPPEHAGKLIAGVSTPEGFAKAVSVTPLSRKRLRITLRQGLKRQIRLMFEALENHVSRLERIRIGALTDDSLAPGEWRQLGGKDLAALLKGAGSGRETLP